MLCGDSCFSAAPKSQATDTPAFVCTKAYDWSQKPISLISVGFSIAGICELFKLSAPAQEFLSQMRAFRFQKKLVEARKCPALPWQLSALATSSTREEDGSYSFCCSVAPSFALLLVMSLRVLFITPLLQAGAGDDPFINTAASCVISPRRRAGVVLLSRTVL